MSNAFPNGGYDTYTNPNGTDFIENRHAELHTQEEQSILNIEHEMGYADDPNHATLDSRVRTGWNLETNAVAFTNSTTFTITEIDRTSILVQGMPIRFNYLGTVAHGVVSSSTYNILTQVTTVVCDGAYVPNPINSFEWGVWPSGLLLLPSQLAINSYKAMSYLSANQSIPNNTATQILFDSVFYDPNSNYSSSFYTVPFTGFYTISLKVNLDAAAGGGFRSFGLCVNDISPTNRLLGSEVQNTTFTGWAAYTGGEYFFNKNDKVGAYAYQASGGGGNIVGGNLSTSKMAASSISISCTGT